jgi:hypothetical protein
MRAATHAILIGLITLAVAAPAQGQTIITPRLSANLKTTPGFIDLDDAASGSHIGTGVSVSRLGDGWFGFEAEVGFTPSAFSGNDLVESSRLLIATGNVLAVAPMRWGLRPYASIGVGVAQIKSDDVAHLFVVNASRLVGTIGAGAWTWLTPRVGIRAGIDFLRTIRDVESGPFETWRPSVGVSIKF